MTFVQRNDTSTVKFDYVQVKKAQWFLFLDQPDSQGHVLEEGPGRDLVEEWPKGMEQTPICLGIETTVCFPAIALIYITQKRCPGQLIHWHAAGKLGDPLIHNVSKSTIEARNELQRDHTYIPQRPP